MNLIIILKFVVIVLESIYQLRFLIIVGYEMRGTPSFSTEIRTFFLYHTYFK